MVTRDVNQRQRQPGIEQLLSVRQRADRAAIVVTVVGEVDLSTVGRLRAGVGAALAAAGGGCVVVDLRSVRFLGAVGLAALADAAARAGEQGAVLRVVVDEPCPVIRLLRITGLDQVLALCTSVSDGVAS
ncbi:anti-sigma factor antagonist [Pseudonocardia acaciae]|uniref:anti-sigma factor antagonist n=1 Tax=Pseudonocardia acaciae TaxID=551276 RepID=UPI0006889AFE|nr:anti-sigma factor antagonist [Pseudonocardia acaciae]